MPLLSRKAALAVAAVIDIALNSRAQPVSARTLAARHGLPPRHLEPVLQALVREGILRGTRGPHGGYALAREGGRITAEDILRAAGTVEDASGEDQSHSSLLDHVVIPVIAQAERAFLATLGRINIDDMTRQAERAKEK
jgi:Rrf2 family transcriptional regulator, iron-sulfur cluster assembly transcription factor